MGYANANPYTTLEFGGTYTTLLTINEAGADVGLSTIHLPSALAGTPIKSVYVDVLIGYFCNMDINTNYTVGASNITATRGGSTTTCITLPDMSFYMQGGASFQYIPYPGRRIVGSVDVKSRFAWGESTSIAIEAPVANHDIINLFDCQAVAKLVLG